MFISVVFLCAFKTVVWVCHVLYSLCVSESVVPGGFVDVCIVATLLSLLVHPMGKLGSFFVFIFAIAFTVVRFQYSVLMTVL